MLPDKPIMLRWRQSDISPTESIPSHVSSAKSGMSSFTVSLPKTAKSPKKKTSTPGGSKFVNFTAASPHQKKNSQRSKEKRKVDTSPKGHPKTTSKAEEVRTSLAVLEPSQDHGLQAVTHYPSPLDRYFFKATPFPFTSLDSLNTGHYTNYCRLPTCTSHHESIVDTGRSSWHCQHDVSTYRKPVLQSYKRPMVRSHLERRDMVLHHHLCRC